MSSNYGRLPDEEDREEKVGKRELWSSPERAEILGATALRDMLLLPPTTRHIEGDGLLLPKTCLVSKRREEDDKQSDKEAIFVEVQVLLRFSNGGLTYLSETEGGNQHRKEFMPYQIALQSDLKEHE